ncbi:MAG: hypothetical protein ACI9T9_000255 [Oleiphilaceae bacterium]|jgi:hypothetical protein
MAPVVKGYPLTKTISEAYIMFRVNAFTQKGTKFRFRIKSNSIHEVRDALSEIFGGQTMRLVLVEPV